MPAVSPIFKAALEVFEGHILAMHQQQWGPPPPAAAAGVDSDGAENGSSSGWSVTETSGYVNELANALAVFRCVQAGLVVAVQQSMAELLDYNND